MREAPLIHKLPSILLSSCSRALDNKKGIQRTPILVFWFHPGISNRLSWEIGGYNYTENPIHSHLTHIRSHRSLPFTPSIPLFSLLTPLAFFTNCSQKTRDGNIRGNRRRKKKILRGKFWNLMFAMAWWCSCGELVLSLLYYASCLSSPITLTIHSHICQSHHPSIP